MTYEPTLIARLKERYGQQTTAREVPDLPADDLIDGALADEIDFIARAARFGDIAARDALYQAFLPRLSKLSWVVRPFPNTSTQTGLWDRDDVQQETWLVYYELLAMWDEHISFASYLLANFAFRLRDRMLRGSARRQMPNGLVTLSSDALAEAIAIPAAVPATLDRNTAAADRVNWSHMEDVGKWRVG